MRVCEDEKADRFGNYPALRITDQEPDYPIAWRPLPEPYRPEPKTEKPD